MLFHPNSRLLSRSIFSFLFLLPINPGLAQAQIIPDGTLPTSVEQLENMRKITGGEKVGDNLFHSFEEFSIPSGMEAIFNNDPSIQNIFTRITGSEASFIDGLLQTQGAANFFLVNPNGIVFGENAVVDVGGSFIATTANTIDFGEGKVFRVSDEKPLLTWNAPIGLGLDGNNGSITVNGSGNQITNDSNFAPIEFSERPIGLSIGDTKTLALVGNGINFSGGVVTTQGGEIYLTSVETGSVGISQSTNQLTLKNNDIKDYQDINLNQQSLIDASGEQVGNIFVQGQNINLNDASFVLVQNQGDFSDGSIDIKASETLTLFGNSPNETISSRIRSEILRTGTGKGTNIDVSANKVILENIGTIQTATFSNDINGTGGDIHIKAFEGINLNDGVISASTFGEGSGGNIDLSTSYLEIINAASITSSTATSIASRNPTNGNGGHVSINADFIKLGESKKDARSTISSSSLSNGNAGNLTVFTKKFLVEDGAAFSASSFGNGNAGSTIINASESVEVNGSNNNFRGSSNPQTTIRSAVKSINPQAQKIFKLPETPTGNAGDVTINTPFFKVFGGVVSVENQGIGDGGKITINGVEINVDQFAKITAAAASGKGGNIDINTQDLNITSSSEISATAGGDGNGGDININANNVTAKKNNRITASNNQGEGGNINFHTTTLELNEQDSIFAESQAGRGGNINVTTDKLRMKDNSNISTSAGGIGNGGNIGLTADTILAINNSDITAKAEKGNGGNINITAAAILGIEERPTDVKTSDIDASSEFGRDGTVKISDPQAFIQDPIVAMKEPKFDDIEPKFTGDCIGGRQLLTDSRHDNVPVSPDELLGGNHYAPDADFVPPAAQPQPEPNSLEDLISQQGDTIASGNMIVATPDGKVLLVVKSQFESLRKRGCLPANIKILEE